MDTNYDSYKTTDPIDYAATAGAERAKCAHATKNPNPDNPQSLENYCSLIYCDVPYEDHDDEVEGHPFEMPEPDFD